MLRNSRLYLLLLIVLTAFFVFVQKPDYLKAETYITESCEGEGPSAPELRKTGLKPRLGQTTDKALKRAVENRLKQQGTFLSALPANLDYSGTPYLPPVGTQGENSCVGWAVGYYLRTFQQARDIGWQVTVRGSMIKAHTFSPSFIYNQINDGLDQGAYLSDAGDILKNIGAATLEDFPYISGDYMTRPNATAQLKAGPHKIKEWRVLFTGRDSDEYIIQSIREYLNTGDLVVVGGKIGNKFMYPDRDDQVRSIITTESYTWSNHAYVVVGYDDRISTPEGQGAFKILSSWGEEWGDKGFAYITNQALAASVTEGYVFTDLVNEPDTITSLPSRIKDRVCFNINFSGSGLFDMQIFNDVGQAVYSSSNLYTKGGSTLVTWPGRAFSGEPVPDGNYRLEITTCENDESRPPHRYNFVKQSRLRNVSAQVYSTFGVVQGVKVQLVPAGDGRAAIKLVSQEGAQILAENMPVRDRESFLYYLSRNIYDFRAVDLSTTSIEVEVK